MSAIATAHSVRPVDGEGLQPGKFTLLLVEDDVPLRTLMSKSLEMQGYLVEQTDNRLSALRLLKKSETINVVILDLGLPPKEHTTDEGLEVIRQVADELLPVKIIVLTGQDEEKSALEAIREGAFDFLSKPADFKDILASVKRALLFHKNEQAMSADGMTRLQFSARTSDGLKAVREEAEEKLMRKVLMDTDFNIYQTAAKLGIKRESIYYFMKKFGITRNDD